MARYRKKKSTAEDVVEIVSTLPWWVGCTLAVLSFAILHNVAGMEVTQPTGPGGFGSFAAKQLYATLAGFAQYILPCLFCFGAAISFFKGEKKKKRYAVVKTRSNQNVLFEMSWREFEELVTEFFNLRGYSVKQTGGSGPDGGVDIILSKGNDKYLVQCKQWKAYKVGVQVVRELHGVMAAEGAAGMRDVSALLL